MTRDQLEDWLPRLAAISPDQRVALPGITPERTLQIVGGGIVADEIMKALDVDEIEICRGRCVKARSCAGWTSSAAPAAVSDVHRGRQCVKSPGSAMVPGLHRARDAIRTRDTRFRRAVLYPLSYPGSTNPVYKHPGIPRADLWCFDTRFRPI